MIFNVVGNASQQAIVSNAMANTRFNPDLMLPGLKQKTGKSQITVYFRPLGNSIWGTASEDGIVQINTSLSDLVAAQTFVMEGFAHMSDFFYLNAAQRQAIFNLWHPNGPDGHSWFEPSTYWNQVGEALMDLFVWAFTPWRTQNSFVHKPTEEIAAKLPAIYNVQQPPKPPPSTIADVHAKIDNIFNVALAQRDMRSLWWRPKLIAVHNSINQYLLSVEMKGQ